MSSKILPRSFYERKTDRVAKELLGKFLIRKIGKSKIVAQIVETEAYVGPHDLASHARFGKTKRSVAMFGPAGHVYVYLVYGMYYCLNVVTEEEGFGAAVLIRGTSRAHGPGLVCKDLKIDQGLYGVDLTKPGPLYIIDGPKPLKFAVSKRVGVDYAKGWKDKPLRFMLLSKT